MIKIIRYALSKDCPRETKVIFWTHFSGLVFSILTFLFVLLIFLSRLRIF